jgi:hypothetical protein
MNELLRACIEAATRAPSKHNAQPWRFEVRDGLVELHVDASRAMPASDPDGREMVIGCGAALYALRLAMRCAGRDALTALFPEGPGFSVLARVAPGAIVEPTADELALRDAIAHRHTDRGPLDRTAMPADVPFQLQDAAESQGATLHLVPTEGGRRTLTSLIGRADRALARDARFADEVAEWVRPDDTSDDGIPPGAFGPGAAGSYRAMYPQRDFDVTGLVRRDDAAAREDRPLAAVLWTDGDGAFDWLRAGMALEAVLLQATVRGVSASFLNQPVEVPDLRARLRDDLALPGFPQVVLRLGVGSDGVPAPRRPVEAVTSETG